MATLLPGKAESVTVEEKARRAPSQCRRLGEEKNLLPSLGIEPRFVDCPSHTLVIMNTGSHCRKSNAGSPGQNISDGCFMISTLVDSNEETAADIKEYHLLTKVEHTHLHG